MSTQSTPTSAILAIRSAEKLALCSFLLRRLGVTYSTAADAAELRHVMKRTKATIVIAEAYLENEPTFDLISNENGVWWLVLLNVVESWGAGRHILSHSERAAILDPNAGMAEFLEAIRASLAKNEAWFEMERARWTRGWMGAFRMFPSSFGEEAPNAAAYAFERHWLKTHFSVQFPCLCCAHSTISIICRIVGEHLSGVLSFARSNMHVHVHWTAGLPTRIETNEPLLDQYSFCAMNELITPEEEALRRLQGVSAHPDLRATQYWISETLMALGHWTEGEVDWHDREPELSTMLGEQDMSALIRKTVWTLPKTELLNVSRAVLPFRMRLSVPLEEALSYLASAWETENPKENELFSADDYKAVVERLQKSGTLSELLVYLPEGYPIHQTIYLLLAQGCLEID